MRQTQPQERAPHTASRIMAMMPAVPRVWLVAGGGWIGRGLQVVAQLVAIRILTDGLGTEGYGAFAVLGSLVGWLALSDFSIAISLQNHISERRADGRDADDIIFTASILSAMAAGAFALVLWLAGPWLSALLLGEFDLDPHIGTLAFYAMALPGIGTALGGVAYKIWFAEHRGYLSNLVPAAGTMLGTMAVWLAVRAQPEALLPWTVLLYYAPLAILPLLALAWRAFRARSHRFRGDLVRPLIHRAFRFWFFGVLAAAVLQVDYIIMAQVLPARDIVVYNVASKIFQLVFFVYNALLMALWPVCSEAIARGEWSRIFPMIRRYIVIGAGFTLSCGIGIALFNPLVVNIVAPTLAAPLPFVVIALLTFYTVVRIWSDTFSMLLMSMNDLKILWLVVPVQSLLSIALQTLGASWFGLPGLIIGLIACFMLTVVWVLPMRCRSYTRRLAHSY